MPHLMTTKATVLCPHSGQGKTTATTQSLTIDGGTACVEGDTGVLSCPFVKHPCGGYTLKSMGLNATTIDGRKAILATDFQQSTTGLPLQIIETHFGMDDSVPAAIVSGDGGAEAQAALNDLIAPIVTATPATSVFDSTTSSPASLPITFTLTAEHPLLWSLALINPVLGANVDLTNGAPNVLIAPSGGEWSTPTLVVTLTVDALFMAALGKTTVEAHSFYMTGVSKRGLSAYAVAELKVI